MTTFLQGYEAFITGLGNEGMVFLDQEQHLDQALLSETTIRRNPLTSTKKASGKSVAQQSDGTIVNGDSKIF